MKVLVVFLFALLEGLSHQATLSSSEKQLDSSSTLDSLWNDPEVQSLVQQVLSSNFIENLISGNLSPLLYTKFFINDIYYISRGPAHYENALNRLSENEPELRKALEIQHGKYVNYDNEIYTDYGIVAEYATKFVIPIERSQIENYADFLKNVSEHEHPYFTLVANLPCSYLWCWLGTNFQKNLCRADNVYCETIKYLFGEKDDPKDCSTEIVNAVNKFGPQYDLEKQKSMFRQSVLYELINFNSTYGLKRPFIRTRGHLN